MRRKMTAIGAVGVLVSGAIWLGASSGASAERAPEASGWPSSQDGASVDGALADEAVSSIARGGQRIVVRARTVREADVDVGEAGESPGDFFMFEERLRNRNGNRVVGRDSVRCEVRVRTFACQATAQLFGRGKIEVAGALFAERDNTLAITGGTGSFRMARGQLRVFDLPGGDSLLVFRLIR